MTILPSYNPLTVQNTVPISELRIAALLSFILGITVGVVTAGLLLLKK